MTVTEILYRLCIALAIGLLIGLERAWRTREISEGRRAAGFRTLGLSGLLGGVWAVLASAGEREGLVALAIVFAVFSGAVVFFRYREMQSEGSFGMTTIVAAMLAFSLGAVAVIGNPLVAGAAGVVVAALLAFKEWMHVWTARLTWAELRSTLVLLLMTVVLLPVLPNRTVDPWDALNPFELWLITVMIAAISFAGYVAMKAVGEQKGILISGVAGGLASSTATAMIMSRLGRQHGAEVSVFAAGAIFAGAVMTARVLVVLTPLNREVAALLALPLVAATSVQALAGGLLMWRHRASEAEVANVQLDNPLDLSSTLKFGVLLAVITLLSKTLSEFVGETGFFALAAVAGLADVDALTVSAARLAGDSITVQTAAYAVAIVAAVNTLAKAALGWSVGGTAVGLRLGGTAVAALLVGAATLLFAPGLRL